MCRHVDVGYEKAERIAEQPNHSVAGCVTGGAVWSQADEMDGVVQVDPTEVLAPSVAAETVVTEIQTSVLIVRVLCGARVEALLIHAPTSVSVGLCACPVTC